MSKPAFIPQPLVKTIVSSYIELVLDLLVLAAISVGIVIGLIASFSRYYGPKDDDIITLFFLFALLGWFVVWGIFKLVVVLQLKRQKRWAWIASLVIAGLNFLSFPYMILGIIKLVGLLNNDVISWFKAPTQSTEIKSSSV